MNKAGYLFIAVLLLSFSTKAAACTSVIISGKSTPDGRPVMMKHRDTGELNNRIQWFEGEIYNFVALVNASWEKERQASYPYAAGEAWTGSNSAGFSIMNTATYDLKDDDVPTEMMDREGELMYRALEICSNLADFESSLEERFRNREAAENLKSAAVSGEYKPTSISQGVYETIRLCHLKGGLAIECGDAGIGKTMACKKYAEDYPSSAVYVTVNPCLVTLNAFLKLLCKALKVAASGRKDEMWFRLSDTFSGERKVLIIDEAQHLPIKTIEAIRAFFDNNPLLGICLVGNIETVTNTGRSKEAFAQIRNRTKLTEIRHTASIQGEDIQLLFPAIAEDEKATQLILGIARSEQGLRGAGNVYSNAIDNGNITYSGLFAMAKAMRLNVF